MTDLAGRGPLGLKQPKPPKDKRKPMRQVSKKKQARDASPAGKNRMFVSCVLRKFADGKECQMKSEWCNGDWETVVLCHSRRRAGAGTGQKPHDFWGYHGCNGCHSHEHLISDRELYDAIRRTQYAVYAHFETLTP